MTSATTSMTANVRIVGAVVDIEGVVGRDEHEVERRDAEHGATARRPGVPRRDNDDGEQVAASPRRWSASTDPQREAHGRSRAPTSADRLSIPARAHSCSRSAHLGGPPGRLKGSAARIKIPSRFADSAADRAARLAAYSATPADASRSLRMHAASASVLGKPRDLRDRRLFHRLSLIAVPRLGRPRRGRALVVGLRPRGGVQGARRAHLPRRGARRLTAVTVLLISAAYSRIIEQFPTGGGGYVVATKLLGPGAGVVSGSALLVDYVLTITISIAAAGDALFSFLPAGLARRRSCRSSSRSSCCSRAQHPRRAGVGDGAAAVFLLFLVTHACSSSAASSGHLPELPRHGQRGRGPACTQGVATLGLGGLLLLFLRAYSLGGGTYTGIEAVSNGLPIMREPRCATGKRTMLYMASRSRSPRRVCCSATCSGTSRRSPGKTMNAVLVERLAGGPAVRRRPSSCSRWSPRRCSWSSRRRRGSSTARACWPTWRWTPGCRTASPRSRTGSRPRTASC